MNKHLVTRTGGALRTVDRSGRDHRTTIVEPRRWAPGTSVARGGWLAAVLASSLIAGCVNLANDHVGRSQQDMLCETCGDDGGGDDGGGDDGGGGGGDPGSGSSSGPAADPYTRPWTFALDELQAIHLRNPDGDHLYLSFGVSVNGVAVGLRQTELVLSGPGIYHPAGQYIEGIRIPDAQHQVHAAFTIVSRADASQSVTATLLSMGRVVLGNIFSLTFSGTPDWRSLVYFGQSFRPVLGNDCDGVLATGSVDFQGVPNPYGGTVRTPIYFNNGAPAGWSNGQPICGPNASEVFVTVSATEH
jgi:hypothetical protein